jgi:diaminopimelate decarboxylase
VSYDGTAAPDPSGLAAAVLPAVEGLPLTLVLEPGRSLVASSGVLLTRVLYVKEGHEKRFVVVDAGMNDLLRPALYDAFHHVEPVVRRGRAAELVDVVGPVCETSDFLARRRELERSSRRPSRRARRRCLQLRHVLQSTICARARPRPSSKTAARASSAAGDLRGHGGMEV